MIILRYRPILYSEVSLFLGILMSVWVINVSHCSIQMQMEGENVSGYHL